MPVLVVCGVCGSGKSTIGAAVAAAVDGCAFADADDYHPAGNKAKMARGEPLADGDRAPWLASLRALAERHLASGAPPLVLACSALKAAYRRQLAGGGGASGGAGGGGACGVSSEPPYDTAGASGSVSFVLLDPPAALLQARLAARAAAGDHFMPPSLLASQLAALEVGRDGWLLVVGSGNNNGDGGCRDDDLRRVREADDWPPERIADEIARAWRQQQQQQEGAAVR